MTSPEEKAKEMIVRFSAPIPEYPDYVDIDEVSIAKDCALICVDEIIKTTYMNINKYWQQVREEIEKL